MTEPRATVVIPVYNGADDHLDETLTAVLAQQLPGGFEVIAIDSGSTDGSVDILERHAADHPNLRIYQIPNSEFSHGGTRQWAAELARGEHVAYLSQDAVPASPTWLAALLKGFDAGSRVGGVMGRQQPRPNCFPLQKHEINRMFALQGPPDQYTVYDSSSPDQGTARFYSDVCSAAPRELLLGAVPYRPISYAEDQAFGQDLIERGYQKVYAGPAAVIHSNDVRLRDYSGRMLDEFRGLELSGIAISAPGWKDLLHQTGPLAWADARRALHDAEYGCARKLFHVVAAPLYRKSRWLGQLLAATGLHGFSLERQTVARRTAAQGTMAQQTVARLALARGSKARGSQARRGGGVASRRVTGS